MAIQLMHILKLVVDTFDNNKILLQLDNSSSST